MTKREKFYSLKKLNYDYKIVEFLNKINHKKYIQNFI